MAPQVPAELRRTRRTFQARPRTWSRPGSRRTQVQAAFRRRFGSPLWILSADRGQFAAGAGVESRERGGRLSFLEKLTQLHMRVPSVLNAGVATARARFTSPFAVCDERRYARRRCRHGPHATGPVNERSMNHQECDRGTGASTAQAPAAPCHTPAPVIYTDAAPDARTDAGDAGIRRLEHAVPSRRARQDNRSPCQDQPDARIDQPRRHSSCERRGTAAGRSRAIALEAELHPWCAARRRRAAHHRGHSCPARSGSYHLPNASWPAFASRRCQAPRRRSEEDQ